MSDLIQTCGNCKHAAVIKEDFTQRICRGAPPQVVVVQTPRGAGLQCHWPIVPVDGPTCGAFKPKLIESK